MLALKNGWFMAKPKFCSDKPWGAVILSDQALDLAEDALQGFQRLQSRRGEAKMRGMINLGREI